MEFLSLLFSENNYLFSSAIFIVLGLGILEGTLLMIGLGITSVLAHLHIDIDVGTADSPHLASEFLGWINKGKVPVIMLFIMFLLIFGIIGLLIQLLTGSTFNQFLVAIPAFLLTLPLMRVSSVFLAKIMPSDESTAVSHITLVGKIAEIVVGTARKGLRAEAKVKDDFGYVHYVMVEPVDENEYSKGEKVVLVEYEKFRNFKCAKEV